MLIYNYGLGCISHHRCFKYLGCKNKYRYLGLKYKSTKYYISDSYKWSLLLLTNNTFNNRWIWQITADHLESLWRNTADKINIIWHTTTAHEYPNDAVNWPLRRGMLFICMQRWPTTTSMYLHTVKQGAMSPHNKFS